MTDFEINIAIAEHCGWERHPMDQWIVTDPKYPHSVQPLSTIPKYCEDLNAMHEAEEHLKEHEWESMFELLIKIRWRDASDEQRKDYGSGKTLSPSRAKAKQRAEAFLRTLGKWEEVQE